MRIPEQVTSGFGAGAGAYQRGRPGYPVAILDYLRYHVPIGPGNRVLDVGAGTGKFTEVLAVSGAQVIALEVVPAMLAELHGHLPEVAALNGDAHHVPLRGASIDAVTAATAIHWFADEEGIAELARVLRSDGVLLSIANRRDLEDPLAAKFEAILAMYRPPKVERDIQQSSTLARSPYFEPLGTKAIPHLHNLGLPQLLDLTLSMSYIAPLEREAREAIVAEVRGLVPAGGRLPLRYLADAAAFRRRPETPPR